MSIVIEFLRTQGGDTLVVLVVMTLLLSALVTFYGALAPPNPLKLRLETMLEQYRRTEPSSSQRRRAMRSLGSLRQVVERLKMTRGVEARRSAELLLQAGWRNSEALVIYSGVRLVLPLVLAVVMLVLVAPLELDTLPWLGLIGTGALLGLYLPLAGLRSLISARHQRLKEALPDALDLLVICAESGLGLDGAIGRIARELNRFQPEMAAELILTGLELGFLPNRRDAFQNLVQRVDIPAMRSFVHTLIQTERYGTPLTQSLKVLSAEMREERMMKAEERASRLPAIMTVPMIVFVLPAIFLVLLGPALIDIVKSFS